MSDTIISQVDNMGSRVDELEKQISELMTQAGNRPNSDTKGGDQDAS